MAPARVLHRVRTGVWLGAEDSDRCFDRIDEALDLIARFDPDTLGSIQKQFRGILVFGEERFRSAYWVNEAALCVITSRHLESEKTQPEHIALTLVHELTHARLCASGIPYEEGRRGSIEVICAMAELAFAQKLPNRPDLTERAERRITEWSAGREDHWSDDTMREAKLEQLREMGTPNWILAVLRRISRYFGRRAA